MADGGRDILGEIRERELRQVADGEICYQCRSYILFGRPGHRRLCHDCNAIDADRGETRHRSLVRCPACGRSWDAHESEDYDLYSEGEHGVRCPDCDHEFEVRTVVSYTFRSPARLDDGDIDADDDGDPAGGDTP